MNDFLNREIHIGDTVIAQDGSKLTLGRASHISAAGNMILRIRFSDRIHTFTRIIRDWTSEDKVIITNDPVHIQMASNIKIKGE